MKEHQHLKNDFHRAGKSKKSASKILRVWTKNEENSEKFQENFEIFWSKSLWKIGFFHIFYQIFFRFLTQLRKYIPLEDNIRFLQLVPILLGRTFRHSPPPDATAIVHGWSPILIFSHLFIKNKQSFKILKTSLCMGLPYTYIKSFL